MKIIENVIKGIVIAILVFIAFNIAIYLIFFLIDGVHYFLEFIGIENTGETLKQSDILNIFNH